MLKVLISYFSISVLFQSIFSVNQIILYFVKTNSVREDAAEGTIVETILTVDLDEDNGNSSSLITPKYLAFYIFEGNEQSHFKVRPCNLCISIHIYMCIMVNLD